ncbi:MAG: hypothetical protein IIX84_01120, partial [Oscillospiraceae bacterium]|nr:hypothetical protein [Oscillospiraceae bacterium]
IESGNSVSFYVFDDEGYRLQYSTNLDSGDGLNVELDGGKTYTLCVTEYSGFVPYTFIIGAPKDAVDITGYDIVNDSIQFNGQKNLYSFTADRSGDHDFVISNTQNGFSCSVYVYNSDGYRIDYGTSLSDDEYVSVGLDQGETYTVEVVYYSGYGEYSLIVR